MLNQNVTHYFPWDESDAGDEIAYCGRRMTAADRHSPAPTCATCAATLDAVEAAFAETPLPLDADEARTELDPVLNAGTPAADLFGYAVSLAYAARRFA
jgi:hypothetical protein